jgi:hypothetical protein
MSCKKYVLKKDLKTVVVKSKDKLPSVLNSPTTKPNFTKNCPLSFFPIIKKPQRVAKSLQTLKGMNKRRFKSNDRRNLDMSLPNAFYQVTLTTNLRYMKANPEEFEGKNAIITPSDSIKSKKDSMRGTIENEYQNYINLPLNNSKKPDVLRSITPDTFKNLHQGREQHILAQTPPDFRCFWKSKRIF